jgi:hypothetical protein
MTAKAQPAGWVVQVAVAATNSVAMANTSWRGPAVADAPSFQYFNAAIDDPAKAVEATKKLIAKGDSSAADWPMSAVRGLSSAEIAALKLKVGEVKPA